MRLQVEPLRPCGELLAAGAAAEDLALDKLCVGAAGRELLERFTHAGAAGGRKEDDGLVAYAKENNTVASTNGAQASNHIGAQAFANSAGFKYTDLPQGNTNDELVSLLGGEADWCVVKAADIAGRTDVKVLAVFSEERLAEYPDVPTLGEKGYYDKWLGSSRCIVAPAGVSEEVIKFYEEAFKQTMEDADYLAAASEFATDYKDAATTAALIDEQQAFTESLSTGFWYE